MLPQMINLDPLIDSDQNCKLRDFPGGTVVKNLLPGFLAGDADSIPGLGRSHMPRSN